MPHQEEGVRRILHAWLEDTVWDGKDTLSPLRSFLLFDEPGLGKTRQALTAIARLLERGIVGPYLVCSVKAVIPQWIDEIERHFGNTLQVCDLSKDTTRIDSLTGSSVAIVSFSTMGTWFAYEMSRPLVPAARVDRVVRGLDYSESAVLETYIRYTILHGKTKQPFASERKTARVYGLFDTMWTVVVFDEIHLLTNTGTSQTRAARYLNATYRLGLSGTPLRNSGRDMITLLKYPLDIRGADFSTVSSFSAGDYATTLLTKATFGRLKKDVPEVAATLRERDAESENIIVSWSDDLVARDQYLAIRDSSTKTLEELARMQKMPGESRSAFNLRKKQATTNAWSIVHRLQQTCLHRNIIDMTLELETATGWPVWSPQTHPQFPPWFRQKIFVTLLCLKRAVPPGVLDKNMRKMICGYLAMGEEHAVQPSPKMLMFMQIYHHMLGEGRNKIIAASESRVFLERILMPYLQTNGIGCVLYAGGSDKAKHAALSSFKDEPTCHVLCLVKQAGAHGLNLQFCNYLVQFDPHWNASRDEQAVQRIHRMGQQHNVHIFKLWMYGSIDMAIRAMQEAKIEAINNWTRKGDGVRNLDICSLHLREQDKVHVNDEALKVRRFQFVQSTVQKVIIPAPAPMPRKLMRIDQHSQRWWLGTDTATGQCLYTKLQEIKESPNLSGWTKTLYDIRVPMEFPVPSKFATTPGPVANVSWPHVVVSFAPHKNGFPADIIVMKGTYTYAHQLDVYIYHDWYGRVYIDSVTAMPCYVDQMLIENCTAVRLMPGQILSLHHTTSDVSTITYHYSDQQEQQMPLYAHQQRVNRVAAIVRMKLTRGVLVSYLGQLGVARDAHNIMLADEDDGIVREISRMDLSLAPPIGFIGEPIAIGGMPCVITAPCEAVDANGNRHLFQLHEPFRVGSMLPNEEYKRRGGIAKHPVADMESEAKRAKTSE